MISLRKTMDVLMDGTFTSLYEGKTVYAYERRTESDCVVVLLNMSAKTVSVPKTLPKGEVLRSNYEGESEALRPFEFRLLRPVKD